MSINNCILKSLNMKEKNVNFKENFVEEKIIKKKRNLVYIGYLSNNIIKCPNSYLELEKQRYYCKDCKHTITAKTNIVNYRCSISNNTKLFINNYIRKKILSAIISIYEMI